MTSAFQGIGRGFKWLAARWYIPLTLIGGAVAFVALGRRRPSEAVADELDRIRESEHAELFAVKRGANVANQIIDHDYRRTLESLGRSQREKADSLRKNPGRRVRYLRRIADRLREQERKRERARDSALGNK